MEVSKVLRRVAVTALIVLQVGAVDYVSAQLSFPDLSPLSEILPIGFASQGPSGSCLPVLLRMPDVLAELGIDASKLRRIESLDVEHRRVRRSIVENSLAGRVFKEPVDPQQLRRIIDRLNQVHEEQLLKLFDDRQQGRLAQLKLQLIGESSVFESETARRLKLSEAQILQLAEIRRGFSLDDGVMSQFDANRRIQAVLTETQLQQLETMKGAPFDFLCLRKLLFETREKPTPGKRYEPPTIIAARKR